MSQLEALNLPDGPLFETDGIRRVWGDAPLDEHNTPLVARAIGTHLAKSGGRALLAHDQRAVNGPAAELFTQGLTDVGVDVTYLGDLPTAALAYSTMQGGADFGVMLSASHNNHTYTGIKTFKPSGRKLEDHDQNVIEEMIRQGVPTRGEEGTLATDLTYRDRYEEFLIASAQGDRFNGWRVGLDTANGAATGIAGRVLHHLGFEVDEMGNQPDGRNINDNCGVLHPEQLCQRVMERGYDAGQAHDGDSDRVEIYGPQGQKLDGDYIMYVLGSVLKLDGLVATDMTNLGVEEAMNANGIRVFRAGVGDRQVIAGLEQTGYKLGGEQSGHIIVPEFLPTGDGILGAIQFYRAVERSGRSLEEWHSDITPYPQRLINFDLPNHLKPLLKSGAVQEFIARTQERLGKAQILIRPSGTEPVGRVMVQSKNADADAEQITAELQELLAGLIVTV